MKEFVVEGRKIPLDEVRQKTLQKCKAYTRNHQDNYYDEMSRLTVVEKLKNLNEFDDSEGLTTMRNKLERLQRQRHLIVWHDHSTVANHGYLVFMVACIYDPAFYLTSKEYFEKTGLKVDIQSVVEKPEIYIVGRCKSSDAEQLGYIGTRCDCLRGLANHIDNGPGVPVTDLMRFFKGDGPAIAFETGQQKGGHYFCSVCGMHAIMSPALDYVFRCKHVSLGDKQEKITNTSLGKNNPNLKRPHPLKHLTKNELIIELTARNLEFREDNNKLDLEKKMEHHHQGVQRVPALLFNNTTTTL